MRISENELMSSALSFGDRGLMITLMKLYFIRVVFVGYTIQCFVWQVMSDGCILCTEHFKKEGFCCES